MDAQRYKMIKTLINKFFFYFDSALTLLCLIMVFPYIQNRCLFSFYLFYSFFFLGQALSHYAILRIPKLDAIKFSKLIKRIITAVGILQVFYLLLTVVFWQKSQDHPIYCALCKNYGFSQLIGIVIIIHFLVTFASLLSFIQTFISRKYYLIALGGFDAQARIIAQRQQSLRRMALIQPNYSYPIQYSQKSDKYYKFEDIQEDVEGQEVCSICLLKKKQNQHFVKTSCNHLFHRQCIQKWATINSKCPDCRGQFQQQTTTKPSSSEKNSYELNEEKL